MSPVRRLTLFALSLLTASSLSAQTGLLIVAHGAGADWNGKVREVTQQVSWRHGPVATAFLMGPEAHDSGWENGVQRLVKSGAKQIIAVPLMVSTYGAHVRQMQFYAGLLDAMPAGLEAHDHGAPAGKPPVPIRLTSGLDASPELGLAFAQRWGDLSPVDRRRPVMLVAHGPSDSVDAGYWTRNLLAAASVLRAAGLSQDIRVGLLKDDAPAEVRAAAVAEMRDTIAVLATRAKDSVVVLPVLISSGPLLNTTVPGDLRDLPIRYVRLPLAPLPVLARWIERMGEEGRTVVSAAAH
jgi:sirohydrochlorin cobaltochelatase